MYGAFRNRSYRLSSDLKVIVGGGRVFLKSCPVWLNATLCPTLSGPRRSRFRFLLSPSRGWHPVLSEDRIAWQT